MLTIHVDSFPSRIKVESRGKSKIYIVHVNDDLDANTAVNGVERARENLTRIQQQAREKIKEYNDLVNKIRKLKDDPVLHYMIESEKTLAEKIKKLKIEVETKRASRDALEKRIEGLKKERDSIIEEILSPNKEELLYSNDDNWKEFIVPNPLI